MATADEDLSQFDISAEEKDRLVAEVIRYVLFKTQQNSGCPIKRDELTQLVTKNYRQRALPAFVINVAKERLLNIFGYEMRELQRSRPSTNQGRSSQQSLTDAKSYVIISQLPPEVYKKYVEDGSTSHLTGFTFVIIGIVYLAGGKIQEGRQSSHFQEEEEGNKKRAYGVGILDEILYLLESLWHHLRRLGLSERDESHPILGNIKQALEALVQQRYLQKEKANGPEGNTLFYELAERALDGPISERIKEFISQIVHKDAPPADID